MKKSRKFALFIVLVGFLLAIVADIYAWWVNCSSRFPDTCNQGGCLDPQWADNCWLYNCGAIDANDLHCKVPPKN